MREMEAGVRGRVGGCTKKGVRVLEEGGCKR